MAPFVTSSANDQFLLETVIGQGMQTLILNPAEAATDQGTYFASEIDKITGTDVPAVSTPA
jgi:hypothetical protein